MNNTSTSCSKKETQKEIVEKRNPKPETIAILRYFARIYNSNPTTNKIFTQQEIQ